jgi:glucans biosynthesis protein C
MSTVACLTGKTSGDPTGKMSGPAGHVVYFDWLKFLVVYGIVVYHAALPFAYASWLIGSRDRSIVLTGFTAFTFPWGIPLLFLLSGAGDYFALRSHGPIRFLLRRILRLGLPLVLGVVVLSPLQAYFVNTVAPRQLGGMLHYYPHFLRSLRLDWTPQWLGHYGYHLWFIGYLLAITAATLPVMEWLRAERGRRWVAGLAVFSHRRGGILVFAVPLVVSQLLLRQRFPVYQDWADVATYIVVFLAGYVLVMDRDFEHAIRRNAGLALILGVVSTAVVGLLLYLASQHLPVNAPRIHALYDVTLDVFWSLNIWCWCLAVLYLGVRCLRRSNEVVRYGSESALPVYIISHPLVVIFGSYVVGWSLPLWPRFLLLLGLAFASTLAIYEFAVRRWAPTRFLFGLRPLPHSWRSEDGGDPPKSQYRGRATTP